MQPTSSSEIESIVPQLRDDIVFSNRQNGSGLSYLMEDQSIGRFYGIGKSEYQFMCLIDGVKTLKQAFDEYQVRFGGDPDTQLGWEQAVKIFEFLNSESLLHSVNGHEIPSASENETTRKWINNVNPLGFRLDLFSAEPLAQNLSRTIGWLFGPFACAVWILCIGWAIALVVGNSTDMMDATKVVIQPENWIWLTLCWLFLKVIHESAHAVCCKVFGGQVGEAGINFLLFLPMPFVDVSSSWRFESRWKRIYVAMAGIYAELFVAAIFVVLWAYTDHPILDSIAVQMVLMASVMTLLFNANPLMKFDGYFVLSDLLRRPNLATNGARYQKSWVKQLLFGVQAREDFSSFDWTTKTYGWLAALWRILVAVGLLIGAAKLFHGAGIVLAAIAIFLWYLKPAATFVWNSLHANTPQQISKVRCFVTFCACSMLFLLSTWMPWPFAPYGNGVVDFSDQQIIRATSDGFLTKVLVQHGQHVSKGDLLAELENQELEFKYRSLVVDRQIAIVESRKLKREKKLAEYQAEQRKIQNLNEQIRILKNQTGKLLLTAPCDGFVVANDLNNNVGAFFKQGEIVMKVVSTNAVEIVSCVQAFDAPLFRKSLNRKVIIEFESGSRMESQLRTVEPKAIQEIIHPALSAQNGGPLPVKAGDPREEAEETELAKPVFKVKTVSMRRYADDTNPLLVGQRCRVYLAEESHSCFRAICFKVSNWLSSSWEQQ